VTLPETPASKGTMIPGRPSRGRRRAGEALTPPRRRSPGPRVRTWITSRRGGGPGERGRKKPASCVMSVVTMALVRRSASVSLSSVTELRIGLRSLPAQMTIPESHWRGSRRPRAGRQSPSAAEKSLSMCCKSPEGLAMALASLMLMTTTRYGGAARGGEGPWDSWHSRSTQSVAHWKTAPPAWRCAQIPVAIHLVGTSM